MSQLKFYSVGIAAENKALDSDTLEVSPIEDLPLANGELTTNTDPLEVSSHDKNNKAYSAKTNATNTVPALWLPFCNGNRVHAPDVRRGAVLMLYQMGDENRYYWTTLKNDIQLRKLETVLYAFSASQTEGAPVDGNNYYFLEISTHKKLVTFHTSKANGEPYAYDLQFDTGTGSFMLKDDIDNFILLDSAKKQIRIQNSLANYFEIVGNDCNLYVEGNFNKHVGGEETGEVVGSYNQKAGGSVNMESTAGNTFKGPTNTMDSASTLMKGNMSVKSGNGAPGDGTIDGVFNFSDSITVQKQVNVQGELFAKKVTSEEAISAPNV